MMVFVPCLQKLCLFLNLLYNGCKWRCFYEGEEYYQVAYTVRDADGKTLERELAPLDSIKDHNYSQWITAQPYLITELNSYTY